MVELLVVIAIISLLAALLLPALAKSKDGSRTTLCVNHLHQLAVAAMVYDSDNRRLPSMLDWLCQRQKLGVAGSSSDLTKGQLYPYLQSKAVFSCPTETARVGGMAMDHSYQIQCMDCHAHEAASCLAPARTAYFLEATNLSPGFQFGVAFVPSPTQLAFRHAKREHFVFLDMHVEKLTRAQYQAAPRDPRFWYPTLQTGMLGQP